MKTFATASTNTYTRPYMSRRRFVSRARSHHRLGKTPSETVEAVSAWSAEPCVRGRATDVSTNARAALELVEASARNFVHIALALLRAAGIPAR